MERKNTRREEEKTHEERRTREKKEEEDNRKLTREQEAKSYGEDALVLMESDIRVAFAMTSGWQLGR